MGLSSQIQALNNRIGVLPVAIHNAGEIPAQAEYKDSGWWQSNGIEVGVNPESGEPMGDNPGSGAVPPQWIMEELHFEAAEFVDDGNPFEGVGYYRILSRGTGTQAGKFAVSETIVARPWGGDYELDAFPPAWWLACWDCCCPLPCPLTKVTYYADTGWKRSGCC